MGDPVVRTPHLDTVAREGITFEHAYTSCPLCVPARASFMTTRMPSSMEVFNNDHSYSSDQTTFAHSLANAGYDTVLCGRMHFMGLDQSHGFTRRIASDITSALCGRAAIMREDFGDYRRAFTQQNCTEIIAEGNSPVLEYDQYIIRALEDYLKQEHSSPQMIVCGGYAPHFPYVAPSDKIAYYLERLSACEDAAAPAYADHAVCHKRQRIDKARLLQLRATYYAMVETMDENVGRAKAAFDAYLLRTGHQGIFIYVSDHGDQIGRKGYFGKQTFYEYSVKIPLILSGFGIRKGCRVQMPVSIMDIGQTLCGLTGAEHLPVTDGVDLTDCIRTGREWPRIVRGEFYDCDGSGKPYVGRMACDGQYKYIRYTGYEHEDLLFDLQQDSEECENLLPAEPAQAHRLCAALSDSCSRSAYQQKLRSQAILEKWGAAHPQFDTAVWTAPEHSRKLL